MNSVELVEYIFESKSHSFEAPLRALLGSSRFLEFAEVYRDKMRKKIRDTDYDDDAVEEVMAEIKLAHLMLQVDRFSKVEYERYGTEERNPDLTVTDGESGLVFNLEVKRIRCTDAERRFEAWKQLIARQVRAVPSGLAFRWDIGGFDTPADLVARLEAGTEEIASYIARVIVESEEEIAPGSEKRCSVPGFEGVEFDLTKPTRKPTSNLTLYYGGSFPLFITHNEYNKFGDKICDPAHLGQMRPDMVNILAIITDSGTHDDFDLGKAVASLEELTAQGDDEFFVRKGFKGRADYIIQLERLSGILFRGWVPVRGFPNVLLRNNRAKCSVPDEIGKILQMLR